MKRNSAHRLLGTIGGVMGMYLASGAQIAPAAEASRVVAISGIHPTSSVRPAGPSSANIVRLYVNAAAWGTTSCRTDAADISIDDPLLFAVVMMAYHDQKTITIYVDDTVKLVSNDTVCRVTAAYIS